MALLLPAYFFSIASQLNTGRRQWVAALQEVAKGDR
jgi:hypothetical protein